ncbi:MAG TPA: ATPase, T2SS/T4P/T4SS family, partial [Thermoanaerobaculia bacterium]
MSDHLSDTDLNQLVRELNRREGGSAPAFDEPDLAFEPVVLEQALPLDGTSQSIVGEGEALDRLLAGIVQRRASDLLLIAGLPPIFRVNGRLAKMEDVAPLEGEEVARMLQPHVGAKERKDLEERGSTDFTLRLARRDEETGAGAAWRFRVNLHRQRGEPAAALRALPTEIPTLASLNLPAILGELVKPSRGLVLVCGPTGSGKSSTLAAMVGEINRSRTSHIITIEDPIEYEHRSVRSVVEHVEVGRDARSFHEALRASLRQDPDVILVGEMRDLETVATALTAAETGHLVLSTLHTNDA